MPRKGREGETRGTPQVHQGHLVDGRRRSGTWNRNYARQRNPGRPGYCSRGPQAEDERQGFANQECESGFVAGRPLRRVSVVGSTGSGKTTFARELARRLGVPFVELDALAWGPNWTLVPKDVFQKRVAVAIEGDAWVVDGNYGGRGARDLVWPRADAVIWLDPPMRIVFARLFERAVRRIRSREELWPGTGNRETFRNQFLSRETLFWWALKTYRRRRRELPAMLARPENAHLTVHRFRRLGEAEAWLATVAPATAGS